MRSSVSLTCRPQWHFGAVTSHNCALRIIRERADHLHHHPTRWRRSVHRFGETAKARFPLLNPLHNCEHIAQRAGQTIEFPDDQHVAFTELTQQLVELGPIPAAAGGLLAKDEFTAGSLERCDLGRGVLLAGGDASVADEHDCLKVLRRCLIMQYPSAT